MARKPKAHLEGDDSINPTDDHAEPPVVETIAEPVVEPAPPTVLDLATRRVMLLCDHVFLPEDPTQAGWETSSETRRYDGETDGRRTKLDVHPDLAAFLQDRKQAEILD